MNTLFLSCLIGGIIFALVNVIMGDWLNVAINGALNFLSADGYHVIQPTVIVGGITIFGGTGLLLEHYTHLDPGSVVILAVVSAILISLLLYFFYIRPMERSENSIGYSVRELTGSIGEVIVPIPEEKILTG